MVQHRKNVLTVKPEDLHFSEVNGGVGPHHGPDHTHPDWTPDCGPFTGHNVNWKKHRHRHTYAIHARKSFEDGAKPTWLRIPLGSETWTQDEINGTWAFDDSYLDNIVKSAKWLAQCKADVRKAQEKSH